MKRKKFLDAMLFWLISGFSVFTVYFIYIKRNIPLESDKGIMGFCGLLFLYFCWFIFDTAVSDDTASLAEAIKFNLTKNPAVWAVYAFWAIFLVLPIFFGFFL